MAGDTRDTSKPPPRSSVPDATSPPERDKSPKNYEVFNAAPPNANALPEGYGLNTAGAKPENPTLSEAVKTVRLGDFKQVYMYPCVRESLLTGIGGAFALGGGRFLFGTSVLKASNWAVGAFCFLGIGSYEYCLQKRRIERGNMKRVVEVLDRKRMEKAEKDAQMQAAKEQQQLVEEQAEKAKRSSWKFW